MIVSALVALAVVASGWLIRRTWSAAGVGHAAALLDIGLPASSSRVTTPIVRVRRRLVTMLRTRKLDAALIAFAEAASRSMRAGASLVEAMGDAGRAAGPPIDGDMLSFRRRIDAGDDVSTAVARWSTDRPVGGVQMLSATCRLGYELGGPVADGFDSIAGALRARRDVAAEARSLSSQARASAALLLALPVVVGTVTALIDPATRDVLLATPIGWACIAGASVLDAAGLFWMRLLLQGGR